MIEDVRTVIWKEWRELRTLFSGRGRLNLLLMLTVFGVFMPLQAGVGWLTRPLPAVGATWMAIFLVTSVVADAFAGERERHTLETLLATRLPEVAIYLGKVLTAVVYAVGVTWLALLLSWFTANVAFGEGSLRGFPLGVVAGSVVFPPLGAGLMAGVGVWISLRAVSVREAQQTLSIAVMLLLFVPVFGFQALPSAWQVRLVEVLRRLDGQAWGMFAASGLAALDGLLLYLMGRRFQRSDLLLD